MKPVDKTKKSNNTCEHCVHGQETVEVKDRVYGVLVEKQKCALTGMLKYYWNRCKSFKWMDEQEIADGQV
ncbi:MAG: hypothetical protein PHO15_03620 [Eubacteriales bacterium]|nr:hypothetical protein [Eubacteriales bacterium]